MKPFVTIVIGDIHERVLWIEPFIDSLNGDYDEIVLLGDYFDSFGSTREKVERTAQWLKHSVNQPHRIHLFGNHDLWPAFPLAEGLCCSGNDLYKTEFINTILSREDWDKLKLYHYSQDFYFCHGGLTENNFCHPINGITESYVGEICGRALELARRGVTSPILRAGFARGGRCATPGITWTDFNSEAKCIKDIRQIVGHTPHNNIKYKYMPNKKYANSVIIDVDTHLKWLGRVTDGVFSEIENPILGSW